VASGWQLFAFSTDETLRGGRSAPVAAPLRLPSPAVGFASLGGYFAALGGIVGQQPMVPRMHVVDRPTLDSNATDAFAGDVGLLSGLFAEAAPLAGAGDAILLPKVGELGGVPTAFAGAPDVSLWGNTSTTAHIADSGILVAAVHPTDPSAGQSFVLLAASGLGGSAPSLLPVGRVRPKLSASLTAEPMHAIHVCATGGCAADEPRLWASAGAGDSAYLLSVGLVTGVAVKVTSPWPPSAGRRVVALAGNETHLMAISAEAAGDVGSAEVASGTLAAAAPEVRVARYDDLLRKRSDEL